MLPKQYADLVSDEDVMDIKSGKAIYSLRRRFVKDDGVLGGALSDKNWFCSDPRHRLSSLDLK